jgi:elongation factor G
MNATKPVIALPIRPRTAGDLERLWEGLQALGSDDHAFHAYTDRGGQIFLAGMGELHLRIIVDRLKQEFGLDAVTGNAEVAYRETITADADGEGKHVSYGAGRGHYAHVKLRLSPGQPGAGYVFANRAERALPDVISSAVDEGVRDAMTTGGVAGCPVDDICVDLCEASFDETGASAEAFRTAGAMAFQDGVKKAKPVLLEPVMRVEINVPDDLARDVLEDLARRDTELQSEDVRGSTRVVTVRARMSRMLGYATALRAQTNGRGAHSMRLDGYQRVKR